MSSWPVGASGLLQAFNEAAVLDVADVRVAQRLCSSARSPTNAWRWRSRWWCAGCAAGRSAWSSRPSQPTSASTTCRGRRLTAGWRRCGPARCSARCYVFATSDLLYLDRYWREEQQVCDDLLALQVSKPVGDVRRHRATFPGRLRRAARGRGNCSGATVTVLTGGPGTGKTTTVARLLALLAGQAGASRLRIALAAPTGKAAARLQEAVQLEMATSWTPPIRRGSASCRRRRCIGCWAAGRTPRRGSGTTAATGCRTTSSSSTRRRWCR